MEHGRIGIHRSGVRASGRLPLPFSQRAIPFHSACGAVEGHAPSCSLSRRSDDVPDVRCRPRPRLFAGGPRSSPPFRGAVPPFRGARPLRAGARPLRGGADPPFAGGAPPFARGAPPFAGGGPPFAGGAPHLLGAAHHLPERSPRKAERTHLLLERGPHFAERTHLLPERGAHFAERPHHLSERGAHFAERLRNSPNLFGSPPSAWAATECPCRISRWSGRPSFPHRMAAVPRSVLAIDGGMRQKNRLSERPPCPTIGPSWLKPPSHLMLAPPGPSRS